MNKNNGNKKMPDFDKLNDRVIAEASQSPSLVIKTNLDPKDTTDENPYDSETNMKDKDKFEQFFK